MSFKTKRDSCNHCWSTGYIETSDTRNGKKVIERCKKCKFYSTDYKAQKAYYREKSRAITYDQWERFYKPITQDGAYYDFHPISSLNQDEMHILDKAKNENRMWTEILSDDNNFTIVPGIAYVNRVAFYVTERPCHLNLSVEDPRDEQTFTVSNDDAKEFLLSLDQADYPFDEYWDEKAFKADPCLVDDNLTFFTKLCKKYRRRVSDVIEITWH